MARKIKALRFSKIVLEILFSIDYHFNEFQEEESDVFIVLLHYVQPLEAIEAHLDEHRRFLDRHYAAGRFLTSGPQVPRTGGVILAKNLSRDELDDVLAEDPFYRKRVATYQVIEFNPTKFGVGFEAVLHAALPELLKQLPAVRQDAEDRNVSENRS